MDYGKVEFSNDHQLDRIERKLDRLLELAREKPKRRTYSDQEWVEVTSLDHPAIRYCRRGVPD